MSVAGTKAEEAASIAVAANFIINPSEKQRKPKIKVLVHVHVCVHVTGF